MSWLEAVGLLGGSYEAVVRCDGMRWEERRVGRALSFGRWWLACWAAGRWWLVVGLLGCWPLCVGRDVADVAWVFGGWSVQVVWGWGRVWYDFGLGRSESDCAAI